jgi:predicted dehydrogenase
LRPDTFWAAPTSGARKAIDDGELADPLRARQSSMSHGMEHWHPNPDFSSPGGGPVLIWDLTIANLINLIGPVKRVAALTSMAEILHDYEPAARRTKIPVKTPTNIQALLEFASGATITLLASWDVAHRHSIMDCSARRARSMCRIRIFWRGSSGHQAQWKS